MTKSKIYEVEELRGHFVNKANGKTTHYLVKWKNVPDDESTTWEQAKNILDKDLIKTYLSKVPDSEHKWIWCYYLDAPEPKSSLTIGWHQCYNSDEMENAFLQFDTKDHVFRTQYFSYSVNFDEMKQKNVSTGKERPLIRKFVEIN